MSRETEWIVFEKAIEVTASAVRGTMGAQGSQPAGYVGDVFREIHRALREASAEMPDRIGTTGFAAQG